MDWGLSVVLCGLFAWAMVSDIRRRTIPNWISLALAVLFAVATAADPGRFDPVLAATAAGLTFAILLAAFLAGLVGGGDVKLMTAAALWTGLSGLPGLFLGTALIGGLMAFGALALRGLRRLGLLSREGAGEMDGLPYGVAIGAAALLSIPFLAPG
ncbi:hypothetical protein AZL_001260 [Azospirillum sp. B510]|uniref:A24 family peptidase n=1 Tax=Azospirillum sp. (strain B510) TaxID=137722 RepID=UPI0001C4B988|nr:prepilin peptidase [Azospirillum sp. B510]BAI70764.1 hypothetical protein AZL_001260 [Azospirillum sp. B510]